MIPRTPASRLHTDAIGGQHNPTATAVNEWAWCAAVASCSPRGKVPERRMRKGAKPAGASRRKKLPFDDEAKTFIRNLRRNATDAEHLVWSYVRSRRLHGQRFRRQQAMGPYVLDFYCHDLKLAIELDGGQQERKRVVEGKSVSVRVDIGG